MMEAIEAAESVVEEIQTKLADPEIYQGDGDEVATLRAALEAAEAKVLQLTERWETLEAIAAASEAR